MQLYDDVINIVIKEIPNMHACKANGYKHAVQSNQFSFLPLVLLKIYTFKYRQF